jgi:hypothetical protein
MKIIHFINDTYQVVSKDNSSIHFQGSKEDCIRYLLIDLNKFVKEWKFNFINQHERM